MKRVRVPVNAQISEVIYFKCTVGTWTVMYGAYIGSHTQGAQSRAVGRSENSLGGAGGLNLPPGWNRVIAKIWGSDGPPCPPPRFLRPCHLHSSKKRYRCQELHHPCTINQCKHTVQFMCAAERNSIPHLRKKHQISLA